MTLSRQRHCRGTVNKVNTITRSDQYVYKWMPRYSSYASGLFFNFIELHYEIFVASTNGVIVTVWTTKLSVRETCVIIKRNEYSTNIGLLRTSLRPTYIHCESKKLDPFSFEHNFGKYCPILIILSLLQTKNNYDKVYPKSTTMPKIC